MADQKKEQKNKELQLEFKAYTPTKVQFAEHGCNEYTAEEFLETKQGELAVKNGVGYTGATQEELNEALKKDRASDRWEKALSGVVGASCGITAKVPNVYSGAVCAATGLAAAVRLSWDDPTEELNKNNIKLAYQGACHETLGVANQTPAAPKSPTTGKKK